MNLYFGYGALKEQYLGKLYCKPDINEQNSNNWKTVYHER